MNNIATEILSSHRTSEGRIVYARVHGRLQVRLEPYGGPARVIAQAPSRAARAKG